MRRPPSFRLAVTLVACATISAGCTNPRQLAYLNEQLNAAADAMNNLRVEMSVLQSSLDSLRLVVAKQDSTIQRIATVTNVSIIK